MIAQNYARIHRQNLVNFGVLPLRFKDSGDYDQLSPQERLQLDGIHAGLDAGEWCLTNESTGGTIEVVHELSPHEQKLLRAGGILNWKREV